MASSVQMSLHSPRLPRKRRWTREQLLRNLEIVGDLSTPLPPTLPPSPPASRAVSPAPPIKRKSDTALGQESSKRPRTNSVPSGRHVPHPHHTPSAPAPPPPARAAPQPPAYSRSEPCEDGEVREDPVPPPTSHLPIAPNTSPTFVPIRRPKRGKPSLREYDTLQEQYHLAGRLLKYSGDARFWSTYPPTHKEYRPLPDPPPSNSSYHKYGGLIARLELVDALVCFTYSIWLKDYSRGMCNTETWATIQAFLEWCKQKWHGEKGMMEAEKAFIGLIYMIEGFILSRKLAYTGRILLDSEVDKLHKSCKSKIAQAAASAEEDQTGMNPSLLGAKSQTTPQMLPSPASIGATSSANSTPTARDGSTPSSAAATITAQAAPPVPTPHNVIPRELLPDRYHNQSIPAHVVSAMSDVSITVPPTLVQNLRFQSMQRVSAAKDMYYSQETLNLPVLARFFPNTFARLVYTTLSPSDEHEPEFEDEEGELFWPGQCITGEGLGWLCLMGKAMIKEFGKAYNYRGLDGVVPKPGEPSVLGQNLPRAIHTQR